MGGVLFAPHNDDETLFASFTVMRHDLHVVICLRSFTQADRGGATWERRQEETARALECLGQTGEQWSIPDNCLEQGRLERELRLEMGRYKRRHRPGQVWAPALEEGGHWQHNSVGRVALEVFGPQVRFYLTYRRGSGKSQGVEVIPTPEMVVAKLRALACYRSQIEEQTTRFWFVNDPVREWVA